jgi:hypothetical protein
MKSKITFNYKNILNPENELLLIGCITILIMIWLVFYAVPGLLSNLFNTVLGKLILLLCVMLVSFKNSKYGVMLFLVIIIINRVLSMNRYSEGLSSQSSSSSFDKNSVNSFLQIQKTINPHVIFDINAIQKQATQEELNYFIEHGYWPWSKETQELYVEGLYNNPYVRTDPENALQTIRTIYNQSAILQLLSYQAKEGQFLLNGVSVHNNEPNKFQDLPNGWGDYAFNSGQISKNNNIIKCGYNKNNNKLDKSSDISLQEIQYMGNSGILYNHVKKITPVDYNNLESIIPGFSFLKEPCNPCQALENPPNYNCPFQLDSKGSKKGISPIWKYLWNK